MSAKGDRIKAAIQSSADALTEALRLGVGSPDGPPVQFEGFLGRDPGIAWANDSFLNILMDSLGDELDSVEAAYGDISTNTTTLPSVIDGGYNIASVDKHEPSNTIRITFNTPFADAHYGVTAYIQSLAAVGIPVVGSTASAVTLYFVNMAGTQLDINNRNVKFLVVGKLGVAGGGGGGGVGVDTKEVKVSSNDSAAGFLSSKLVAGSGVTLVEQNDGANETLLISATGGGGGGTSQVKASANDTTEGYLEDKIVAVNGIVKTTLNDGADEDVQLAPTYGTTVNTICQGNDARLSDARTPTSHATSHQSGGSDVIKLDDLASPDDNTDLDATASAHGLLPKLSGTATEYLDGSGSWSTPAGGSATGPYAEYAQYTTSNPLVISSGTPVQVLPESGSLSYTPTADGDYKFTFQCDPWFAVSGTAIATYRFKVVIDEGLGSEIVVGNNQSWQRRWCKSLAQFVPFTFFGKATLTAGAKTIKVYGEEVDPAGAAGQLEFYNASNSVGNQMPTLIIEPI